jgi:hypothetical protein
MSTMRPSSDTGCVSMPISKNRRATRERARQVPPLL